MDTSRGHLVSNVDEVAPELRDRYTPVPKQLRTEATLRLGGKKETTIDLKESSGLSIWAEKVNKHKANLVKKAKRKISGKSRIRNRK